MNCSQPRIPARILAPFVAFAIGLTGLALVQNQPSAAVPVTEPAIVADSSAVLTYDSPTVQAWTAEQDPTEPAAAPTEPVCEEDMPCWDCETMGNYQCGPLVEGDLVADMQAEQDRAWATWDEVGASRGAVDDPARGFKVEYMGVTPNYPENMVPGDLPLMGQDYQWYLFHVTMDPTA